MLQNQKTFFWLAICSMIEVIAIVILVWLKYQILGSGIDENGLGFVHWINQAGKGLLVIDSVEKGNPISRGFPQSLMNKQEVLIYTISLLNWAHFLYMALIIHSLFFIIWIFISFGKAFLTANPSQLMKWGFSVFFNVIGFVFCHHSKFIEKWNKKTKFLLSLKIIQIVERIRDEQNNMPVITGIDIKRLDFSYNNKHTHKKHILDVWNKTFHLKNFYEQDHIVGAGPDALKNINIYIEKGGFYAIIGPNGSGKTTFIKSIARILSNYEGSITMGGVEIRNINITAFYKAVSFMPQHIQLPGQMSVYEFIKMGYITKKCSITPQQQTQLIDQTTQLIDCTHLLNKQLHELSGGERQQVILANAIIQQPEILILDEPITYLDEKNKEKFMKIFQTLNERGVTIFMVVHDLDVAFKYFKKVIAIKDGSLVMSGSTQDFIDKYLNIFGITPADLQLT